MKNNIITAFLLFIGFTTFGQINMADSSAQVISYWEKGDKYEYAVITQKIKLKDADTTSNVTTIMDVEVKVLAASSTSYTVQWLFQNIRNNSDNPDVDKFLNANKGLKVIYKTDEMGTVEELVNWKEIQKQMKKTFQKFTKEFSKTPEMKNMLAQYEMTFLTKEAIEAFSLKEINQFHAFHGAKYVLDEVIEGQLELPNLYGGKPFDAELSVLLSEIDEEEGFFKVKYSQKVDEEQLMDAVLGYLTKMAKNSNTSAPTRDDIKELKNETTIESIIHELGWVLLSEKEVVVISDNYKAIERCLIDMK